MNIVIHPSSLSGKAEGISSKSYIQRALVCAALARGESRIIHNNFCGDVMSCALCLEKVGTEITRTGKGFTVNGGKFLSRADIDCGESGAVLRFMLAFMSVLGIEGKINASEALLSRPHRPLIKVLNDNGADIHDGPVIKGKAHSGEYRLPGDISSQYISALLMALPVAEENSRIILTSPLQSSSYVDITLSVMEAFGVHVDKTDYGYFIEGNRNYIPAVYDAEADWSSAAFFICMGVRPDGLNDNSLQGDRQIMSLLDKEEIDASDIPDLVPPLAAYFSTVPGHHRIYGASRLKFKETDRLETLCEALGSLGADITATDDELNIEGKETLSGGTVSSHGDHRIAMAAATAACRCNAPVIITGAECVSKSCPEFFGIYNSLGGKSEWHSPSETE